MSSPARSFDAAGRVLIAQRPRGKHMAGRWEFPGGKLGAGEEPYAGLCSANCARSSASTVREARPLIACAHEYPDRRVLLDSVARHGLRRRAAGARRARRSPGRVPTNCRSTTCSRPTADRRRRSGCRVIARVLADGRSQLQSIRGRAAQAILVPESGWTAQTVSTRTRWPPRAPPGTACSSWATDVDAVRIAAMARCDGVVLRWHRAEPARGPQRRVPGGRALRGRRERDAGGRRGRALPRDRAAKTGRCPSACSSGSA